MGTGPFLRENTLKVEPELVLSETRIHPGRSVAIFTRSNETSQKESYLHSHPSSPSWIKAGPLQSKLSDKSDYISGNYVNEKGKHPDQLEDNSGSTQLSMEPSASFSVDPNKIVLDILLDVIEIVTLGNGDYYEESDEFDEDILDIDYENYDGVEIFDHRRVDPMNYHDSRTGNQQKLNSSDKENGESLQKNGTILPNGWKRILKQGAKRSKETFNYVSPSGDLFTSRKEMTRYLHKPVLIKSDDIVVWGFESFKHDLCDNLIVNLGESHDDEEDVYFTLKCQENIKTKSEDVIEEWCEEYAACDKGRGNKVNTLLAENAGNGKHQQKIHVEERGNQLLDEMKKEQLNIAKILKLSRKNKKKRITEKSQTYSRRIKLVRMKITCSRCHRSFDKQSEMLEHVSKCHIWSALLATITHKPPFICPLSECSFLQRNRYNIAQHMARGSDPIHQDFIMKIANSKFPNCFWNNEWRIENSVHHDEEYESLDDEGFDSGGEAKSELEIDIKMKKLKILSQMKTAYARKVMHLQNLKTCQKLDF